jgi:hypothetical protein
LKIPTLKKNQVQMNMFLPSAFYQQWKTNVYWLRLKQIWKDTNKKVLSKKDLSSPIDKPDQQDSTMFSSGNHKIGYFTIDATYACNSS